VKKLKRNLDVLSKKGLDFIKGIKPSDKLVLIYHSDLDGLCSAAILILALKKMGKLPKIKTVVGSDEALESVLGDKTLSRYKAIVVLDIGLQKLAGRIKKLDRNLLIVDHHFITSDFNSKSVIYVNPRFKHAEIYQPISYFIYKLLSTVSNISELEWISALGTVADYGFEDCKDIVSKYGIKKKGDLEKSTLWKAAKILNGAFAVIGFDKELDFFMRSKNIGGLLRNKKLRAASRTFEKEYKRAKEGFWENCIYDEDLNMVFSVIKPRYKRIASALITDISIEHPEKIILLVEKLDKSYKVHARNQSGRINLGKIISKCCKYGGGHRQSAGGTFTIGKNELEKFKGKIEREIRRFSR